MNLTPVLGRIEPMYGIAACSKYLRNPTKAGAFSHQQQATVTHITGTHGGTPPSPFFWFQFIHFWWACLFDLSVCGSFRFWFSDCWLLIVWNVYIVLPSYACFQFSAKVSCLDLYSYLIISVSNLLLYTDMSYEYQCVRFSVYLCIWKKKKNKNYWSFHWYNLLKVCILHYCSPNYE